MRQINLTLGLLTAALLSACGGGGSAGPTVSTSTARGTLVANPPILVPVNLNGSPQLDPVTFAARLNGAIPGITQVIGTPVCSISTYYMKYNTVGSKGEPATATGAIYVPSGSATQCSGPRPVVVYAHGTNVTKSFNMADLQNLNSSEAALAAATFAAAQGFIVVAPNYAGYDVSSLPYTGFLDAAQQSNDVIDSLRAARQAFPNIGAQDSGKLFLTGYSQGAYVALATQQSMQNNYPSEFKVTALAGGSGPYAISALADAIFAQQPNLSGTAFLPLITNAWQAHYGNIYNSNSDASNIYAAPYAATIPSLIPGNYTGIMDLYTSGALPASAMFSSTYGGVIGQVSYGGQLPAQLAPFYGSGNLVSDTFALGFLQDIKANPCTTMTTPATPLNCKPANTVRQAALANDLRTLPVPTVPVLLCGGNNDPTVFFASTQAEQAFLAGNNMAAPLAVLDVDSDPTAQDPAAFAQLKGGFKLAKGQVVAKATAAGQSPATAVALAYHGTLVPPFCNAAAAGFFQQFAK